MHELRSIYCDQFASVNRRPNAFTGQGLLPIKIHLVGMSVISKSFISYTLIDYFNAQNAVNGFQSHVKQTFFFERETQERKNCVSAFHSLSRPLWSVKWKEFVSFELLSFPMNWIKIRICILLIWWWRSRSKNTVALTPRVYHSLGPVFTIIQLKISRFVEMNMQNTHTRTHMLEKCLKK